MTALDPALLKFFSDRVEDTAAKAHALLADPGAFAKQKFGRPGRVQWIALTFGQPGPDGLRMVLADCAAKRWVVAEYREAVGDRATVLGDVIARFAASYSEHPRYWEEWKV